MGFFGQEFFNMFVSMGGAKKALRPQKCDLRLSLDNSKKKKHMTMFFDSQIWEMKDFLHNPIIIFYQKFAATNRGRYQISRRNMHAAWYWRDGDISVNITTNNPEETRLRTPNIVKWVKWESKKK